MSTFVPKYWGCIPDIERVANLLFAGGILSLQTFILADSVDLVFQFGVPLWWEKRLAAYIAAYRIQEETVIIDDVEVRVYLTNVYWMIDVALCVTQGECQADEPRCLQFDFYNSPV